MTAIVGILNRRGLAFAADSAATHRSKTGYKISNNANKLFSLSKYHPVGVALFNNLDFIGVPWDSIIKQFRNSQKDKKYDSLKGYLKPFFGFLKTYCLPNLEKQQLNYLNHIVNSYFNDVIGETAREVGALTDNNAEFFFQKAMAITDDIFEKTKNDKSEDFANYKLVDFEKYAKNIIDAIISPYVSNPKCPPDFRKKFYTALHSQVCHNSHKYLDGLYSGLVFFGYGDKDLFPSFFEFRVSYALDGHIKYTCQSSYEITSMPNAAVIAPFAQTDVANTVVRAVEDNLRKKFYENYKTTLSGFKDEIVNLLVSSKAPATFIDTFKKLNIDKYTAEYCKGMDNYIDKSYIRPLMDTVAFLDKEDLADMAESLVRMTCLKRHVTTDEETVGGPVDVAIVTKGDGFIWKKRKHYFDPDLNSQFFERYNK